MERVYFFGFENSVKIGTTYADVKIRLRQVELETLREPLTLIGSMEGGFPLERAIHRKLMAHRIKGEWFNHCSEVRACINGLLAEGPSFIGFDQSSAEMGKRARDELAARSPQSRARAFGNIARLIWPYTAVEELCALSGADAATVLRWLEGAETPPRIVRFAFGGVVQAFVVPDVGSVISFLDCDSDDFRRLPIERSAA